MRQAESREQERRLCEKEVAERNAKVAAENRLKKERKEAEAKREMELMEARRQAYQDRLEMQKKVA